MLDLAEGIVDETDGRAAAPALAAISPQRSSLGYARSGRYGEKRGFSVSAAGTVVLLHAAIFAALVLIRPGFVPHEEARLQVVDVKLTPPPPPPARQRPKAARLEVVSSSPVVQAPPPPLQLAAPTLPAPDPAPEFKPASAPPAPPAPPVQAAPAMVQGGDLSTQMIAGRPPRYPIECRRRREQGTVALALTLGLDGRVETISIARSSGYSRLDEAARAAVSGWRWAPVIRNGEPVMVRGIVEIPFVLRDDGGAHEGHGRNRGFASDGPAA